MIKKSRKILTLLLAVLLIMSSMSALSVSAADVSFTMSGQDQEVTNAEGGSLEASYTIDGSRVKESGWYNLKVRSDGDANNKTYSSDSKSKYYKLTAKIGNDSWTTVAKINRADTYAEPGRFYLTAGQGFTVTLTYDFSNETSAKTTETVNNLNFTKVDPEIAVSSTQETKVNVFDYLNRSFSKRLDGEAPTGTSSATKGDELNWVGYAMMAKNNYGIYSINVPHKAEYDVYALAGNTSATTLALYVDNFNTAFSSTSIAKGAYKTATYTKLGTTTLDAGSHDLKFMFTGNATVYFYGFKLVPVARNTISSTGTSTIPVKSYLYFETTTSTGKLNTDSTNVAGVYEGKHDYIAFANNKDKVYYTVSSEKAQTYTMSIIASRALNQTFKVTNLDTGDAFQVALNFKDLALTSGNYNSIRYTMGDIELPQGVSTLMVESISGSSLFVYAFELTPPLATISAEINAEYNQGEGYQTVSVPVKFAGSAVMSGLEVAVAYDEAVELTECTAGTTGAILTLPNVEAKPNPAVIIHLDESGVGTQLNEGTLATLEFKVPLSTVKNYEFTIAITEAKGENAVDVKDSIKTKNGVVKVISTDPIFTFTKDGAEVESVENGAMTLNVNLNGNNDKNLVIFAIYSTTSEGYSVLEYSDTATPENGTATITLNVTKVDGVNYYAKAFVWDTTTYYGFTQTLGN